MNPKRANYPNKKLVVRKFNKIIRTFTKKLNDYLNDPNVNNIHDIRISIRRMEAAYRILPKSNRKCEDLQNYVKQAKTLFKINTQIRDFDIIRGKLENQDSTQFAQITDYISNKRKFQLNAGHRLALRLKDISPPKLKKNDIKEFKLQKRFQKIMSNLIIDINRKIPLVLSNDKKVDEIHELRKDFKKMRYSIELTAENTDFLKSIKSLKKIQDELGLIHDCDIFLDYLRNIEGPHELSEIIRKEIIERRERYQKFVQVFKTEKIDPAKLIS